ncbi:MAG: phosphoserine phosphatase RsbU/P, partial [Candidatus Poribacteria bacterium]|nr:phosphoserine phosphatase RsbU/P [Candidatus Poribacteria bacterium]
MLLKTKIKPKINTKILSILLGLSLISLILFAYIANSNMKRLGDYAIKSSTSLGTKAVSDSTAALITQAEDHLRQFAKDQATISSTLFEKVESGTDIMAKYASTLWADPSSFKYRRSYSGKEKPKDIYSASVYALSPGVNINTVKKELDLLSNMDQILIPIFSNDPNLSSVYIASESGIARVYPWNSDIAPSYDPRKRVWYERAVQTGKIGWTNLYVDAFGHGLMITCSKPIYNPEGKIAGVVAADVTLVAMNNRIMNTQVGRLGYAFLLDNNGMVIARPGLSAKDKRWDESFETENLLRTNNSDLNKITKSMIEGKAGIAQCKLDNGERYIAYAPISFTKESGSTSWSLGIVMPVDEIIAPALTTKSNITSDTESTSNYINQQIYKVRNILIGIFVAMILVVSLIAYRLSKMITKPILDLDKGAQIVGGGNLDYRLEVKTGDEIEDLANTFNKMTDNLKIYINDLKETTAAKERIESELKIATQIQASMLPRIFPAFPDKKEFNIFATMEPAKEVGGDFYDFFLIKENKLCFLVGDVSGKGVPASLFMVISKTLLKNVALVGGRSPDNILFMVNNMLYPDNDNNLFVTVFCMILD